MEYSVYLRPFKEEDAYKIYELRNNKKIQQFLTSRYHPASIEIEKKWVREKMMNNNTEEYFAICLNDGSHDMIGYFCMRDIDFYNRKAHMGATVIDPEYQDGIYAIDTSIITLDYAFINIGLNRVTGMTIQENLSSRLLMELFGFKLEGIEVKSIYKNHKYHDLYRYALLYEDYIKMKEQGEFSLQKLAKRAKQLKKIYQNSK